MQSEEYGYSAIDAWNEIFELRPDLFNVRGLLGNLPVSLDERVHSMTLGTR
jgi:hypothetical protein